MKKILSIISFCLMFVLLLSSVSFAYQHEMSQSSITHFLSRINGDWYDYNGNLVLTIKDGYINDCQVTDGFDFAGGYPEGGTVRIAEAAGDRDIHINAFGREYHKYIVMDGNTPLRQTPNAQYYESIGGVYLGMTPEEVIKVYGKPTQITTRPFIGSTSTNYIYQNKGIRIHFDDDIAVVITIYNGSNVHFDKTGYDCTNSLADYYSKYCLNRMPTVPTGEYTSTGAYDIAPGEYLFFDKYPNSISLSLYSN